MHPAQNNCPLRKNHPQRAVVFILYFHVNKDVFHSEKFFVLRSVPETYSYSAAPALVSRAE